MGSCVCPAIVSRCRMPQRGSGRSPAPGFSSALLRGAPGCWRYSFTRDSIVNSSHRRPRCWYLYAYAWFIGVVPCNCCRDDARVLTVSKTMPQLRRYLHDRRPAGGQRYTGHLSRSPSRRPGRSKAQKMCPPENSRLSGQGPFARDRRTAGYGDFAPRIVAQPAVWPLTVQVSPRNPAYPRSARLRVSRPTEPMFRAFVWKALRSKPGRDSSSSRICSQSRWPTL